MKNHRCLFVGLILNLLILMPCITSAEPVVTDPFISTNQADDFKKKVQDFHQYMKSYETPNNGVDIWLPEGFWDGPHESDLGLSMYRMLFGSSFDYVYGLITGVESNSDFQNRTLATSYAKIMNSIGVIIVLTVMFFRVVGFFGMRAIDVSYLNPEKEDEGSFIFLKGMFGVVTSFPLPFLGGMSSLQGLTIFLLLIGLGAATSIIRFSVPWIITPNMVHYYYPNLHETIDHIFHAKVCTKALDKVAKKSTPNSIQIIDITPNPSITNYEARFGHDLDTGISCGTLNVGQFITPKSNSDPDVLFGYLTDKAIAQIGVTLTNQIWNDPVINTIADYIASDNIPKDGAFDKYYQDYSLLTKKYHDLFADSIKEKLMEDLNSDMGNGESYKSKYVDIISNVGFFGLGTFYTSLTIKQNDINEKVASAYTGRTEPSWTSSDIGSSWAWFKNLFSFFNKDSDIEYLALAKSNTNNFLKTSKQTTTDKTPEQALSIATQHFLADQSSLSYIANYIRELLAKELMTLFETTENDAIFYNPIIQLRTMGNLIQNSALTVMVASVAPQTKKAVDAASTVAKKVIGENSILMKVFTFMIFMLLGIGLFFANILPMLPYIMWTIATFTFFSHSVISIIGAGWWSAGFMMSSDRNFTGKTSEGAGVIFTLLVKPSLMTMSFFLSILLNSLFGYFIAITIHKAASNAYYGGMNVVSFFAVIAIAGFLLMIGTIKNLSLIWEMSDMCQRFIGFRSSIEDKSHEDGKQQLQAISSTVSSTLKQSIGSKGNPQPIN
ncbi:DotA/TraY family protein [Vibrio cholerae]|uniref:DotA/TraY family protein n=1 Tax=Vibrio cholerae TaxID=666 RepID=UPI0013C345C4|nr:DotA/TraY family protein [Vibrio cholerae]